MPPLIHVFLSVVRCALPTAPLTDASAPDHLRFLIYSPIPNNIFLHICMSANYVYVSMCVAQRHWQSLGARWFLVLQQIQTFQHCFSIQSPIAACIRMYLLCACVCLRKLSSTDKFSCIVHSHTNTQKSQRPPSPPLRNIRI